MNCRIIAALCLACVALTAAADEALLSFVSDVTVHQNGSMTVSETIRVRAEGNNIKRGIYRDFPTRYKTHRGHDYVVDFQIASIERDGMAEPYHLENRDNGVRVYIGHRDVYLAPGDYTYTLTYETDRQIGFFEDHDELYWNVTGNEWAFPIQNAKAQVSLPASVSGHEIRTEAYTGRAGARRKDYDSGLDIHERAVFSTTKPLQPGEGLTIVVTWPKGHVQPPTTSQKIGYLLRDNRGLLLGLAGLLALLSYYLWAWLRVGRDPHSGVIIPRYSPPHDLSPAAIRYIYKMGFDHRAYAAAIINMAVKGHIMISEDDDDYSLTRVADADATRLTTGERKLMGKLFKGQTRITLKQENHKPIRGSIKTLKRLLRDEYHKVYFHTNGWYLLPGFVISAITLLVCGIGSADDKPSFFFLTIWLTVWTFTVVLLLIQKHFVMAGLFGIFEIAALFALAESSSWGLTVLLILLVVVNVVFLYLVKAPTNSGRQVMDAIEGFKMYLSVAEKNRMNVLHPPVQTPELFEKYLPYALALGVDQQWSEKFAFELAQAGRADHQSRYNPSWYRGPSWDRFGADQFGSKLSSSLTQAIGASSRAPGSSSGGGGGGSSGGGGGGGGGGGW